MNENNLNWFKDNKTWLKDLIISGEERKQNRIQKKKDEAKEWSKYQEDMKARVNKGLKPIGFFKWELILKTKKVAQ